MASLIADALGQVGVDLSPSTAIGAALAFSGAIDQFNAQNASPLQRAAGDILSSVIPPIFRNPNVGGLNAKPSEGDWTSSRYADDLIPHQPKYKFLFKVKFEGFGGSQKTFQYYVHQCDKPKVRSNHQDVNYYNFRTKVQTSVTFEPLSMTFLDEIGNSVNEFFVDYMKQISGQASGGWGTESGFGKSSSSKPYPNGYSYGKAIVVEQIFANGTLSNRFRFINPRIEAFDFDDLSMEQNAGSMATIMFNYDALVAETVSQNTLYSWGKHDLLKENNGGATSLSASDLVPQSATGKTVPNASANKSADAGAYAFEALTKITAVSALPGALQNLPGQFNNLLNTGAQTAKGVVSSSPDTLSRSVSDTYKAISSGFNLADNPYISGGGFGGGILGS